LGLIASHLTLVPPVNVRDDDLPAALAVLRAAAEAVPRRLELTLGPTVSFLPENPVLYLRVGGDLSGLADLREKVFAPPLARPLRWAFVPHVTIADGIEPARVAAALGVLDRYVTTVGIAGVHLLEERNHELAGDGRMQRRWTPIADACFGPAAVVGRGGLELRITRSEHLDVETMTAIGLAPAMNRSMEWPLGGWANQSPGGGDQEAEDYSASWLGPPLAVTARRAERPIGAAQAWLDHDGGHVAILVGMADRNQGVGSHLLSRIESAVTEAGWRCEHLVGHGPAGFYLARSGWTRPLAQI
jgi:2'-5' RNA ligase